MATSRSDSANWVLRGETTNGLGGQRQDLTSGMVIGADGEPIVPEVDVPKGEKIIQQDQIGVFRRTVFSNGAVETVQTEPANRGSGEIITPVPLPGEQQDVTGTGQDAAYQPKTAPGAKTGKSAEKLAE